MASNGDVGWLLVLRERGGREISKDDGTVTVPNEHGIESHGIASQ